MKTTKETPAESEGRGSARRGRLKIGDDWNAITIIALSQSNPLKAVAEFVENAIDAKARHVTITRGREHGEHYLRIADDGEGVPRDAEGAPDFRYVATHICDSLKRRLKEQGTNALGIQGEFGIGLLSFWTVGEELLMTSGGADGRVHQMHMRRNDPGFTVSARRSLIEHRGTELRIRPLLAGIRHFSGEKIQWYLAAELRDRIRSSGVRITVADHQSRREYRVEPREFSGRLLHELPGATAERGELYLEIYLNEADAANQVGLFRHGTRVLESIAELEEFARAPWTSGFLQGLVDVPFLTLTPGTRAGIVRDAAYADFVAAMQPVSEALAELIAAQQRAAEELASRGMLRSIQKAFREALLALPAEEYDWYDVGGREKRGERPLAPGVPVDTGAEGEESEAPRQKQFFEFAGPLYSVQIAPVSCVVPVSGSRRLRAMARDRARRAVDSGITYTWSVLEGGGELDRTEGELIEYRAPAEPCLARVRVEARQGEIECSAEALITVTDTIERETRGPAGTRQGLPGYTFERAPGELWRSRYAADRNVIVVNNAHRDFVYAARAKTLKLRYIARLYAKEIVLKSFPGAPAEQLLERLLELALYTEENLR
jgi:hypothetical protein